MPESGIMIRGDIQTIQALDLVQNYGYGWVKTRLTRMSPLMTKKSSPELIFDTPVLMQDGKVCAMLSLAYFAHH